MPFDPDKLPTAFGPYRLQRHIASGGMAELYLGETSGPGGFVKPVVIKMIHRTYSADPRFVTMFTDEAKLVAGLVHGNIVPIFDFGEIEGRTYLAMEFIDGVDVGTLLEACREQGLVLSPEIALWVGVGAAAGLHYVHSATGEEGGPLGIVHRDVSPHNILVSRAGEVKLCDFGIALTDEKAGDTDAGVIKGKLRYLSPEQAAGQAVDSRSDVFSMGVVLFEMLAGHHPVPQGAGVTVLRTLAEGGSYPALAETAPWLPGSVCQAVDRALRFDPDERYQDAEQLRQDLSDALHRDLGDFSPQQLAGLVSTVQEVSAHSGEKGGAAEARAQLATFASEIREQTAASAAPAPAARKRRDWWIGAAAVALLAALALYLGLSSNPENEEENHAEAPAGSKGGPTTTKGGPTTTEGAQKSQDEDHTKARAASEGGPTTSDSGAPTDENERDKEAEPPKKPRGTGILDANASPWAEVSVDGKPHGTTPVVGLKLPAGRHKVVFSNPESGRRETRRVLVRAGERTRLIVDLE